MQRDAAAASMTERRRPAPGMVAGPVDRSNPWMACRVGRTTEARTATVGFVASLKSQPPDNVGPADAFAWAPG
jgi:hypothetical protein